MRDNLSRVGSSIRFRSYLFRPEPEPLITRASRTRRSPRALSTLLFLCFSRGYAGNACGAAGLGGSPKAQILSLGVFSPLCSRLMTKEIHPSTSASGLFPLWLRRPRFLCAPRFLASIACGLSGSGVALVWGKDASFPQLGFILVPSDSTLAQPPSSIAYECFAVSLPLRDTVASVFVGLRPLAMDAHSDSPEAKCIMLAPPSRARITRRETRRTPSKHKGPFRDLCVREESGVILLTLPCRSPR